MFSAPCALLLHAIGNDRPVRRVQPTSYRFLFFLLQSPSKDEGKKRDTRLVRKLSDTLVSQYLVEGARPVNAWLLLFLLLIARGLHRDRGGPLRRWQEQWRYRWRRGLGSWAGDGSTRTPWGSGPIPSLQSPPHAH